MGETPSKLPASSDEQSSNQTTAEKMEVITKQTCSESVEVVIGKAGDQSAWHVILVSYGKQAIFKRKKTESSSIKIDDVGRNIEYRHSAGVVCQASGYGTAPPEQLMKWINENYDPCAIDDTTRRSYTIDDIRLCTIQEVRYRQPLGILPYYHRHERFHYVKLNDDYQSTLAFYAGIRSFDRVIECNGRNIEDDSAENFKKTLDTIGDRSLQLLVCSPATYRHYKKHNKCLHSKLNTVKHVKPVPKTPSTNDTYELLDIDDTSGPITLVNSRFGGIGNISDTIQEEIDDNRFVTAHEPLFVDPVENDFTESYKQTSYSQVLSKPANVRHRNKDDDQKKKEHEKQKLARQLERILMDHQNKVENGVAIHRTQCCACGLPHIYQDRYKCLECYNYDLCSRCFDQRRETLTHMNEHIMVHFSDNDELFGEPVIDVNTTVTLNRFKEKYSEQIHVNIECNNCKIGSIVGLRFKCDDCHDYNLCVTCMEKRIHDSSHSLIAIGKSYFIEISIDDIQLGDELGRGGFGTVYQAKWLSKNRQVACKIISVPPGHPHREKSFQKELAAYAELSGPYILKTFGFNIQELSTGIRKCMLVMEFMPRGSLSSVLRQQEKIPIRRKLEMACQIASGMRKLHAHGMIHRDIRPDNILVAHDYTAKIGDMGLARVWSPDDNMTLIGCLAYMPYDFYTGKYNQSLDIYTFGLTINELFTEKKHQFDLLTRRIQLTTHSPVFIDLIDQCILNGPSQRPSTIEIETTLRMYKQVIEKYILEKKIKYGNMSIEDKNLTFITSYQTLGPEIEEILNNKFPSRRPATEFITTTKDDASEVQRLLEIFLQHDSGH